MRIALLTTFFPPEDMFGISRYVEDLAVGLTQNKHSVTVIAVSPESRPVEKRNEFIIYWVENSKSRWSHRLVSLALFRNSQKIRKLLNELHTLQPFDIVEYPNTDIAGLSALTQGISKPKPKFVIRLSSPKAIFKKSSILPRVTELLEKWQANLSDALIGNTHENLTLCEKLYNIPPHLPRTVILHGLNLNTNNRFVNPGPAIDNDSESYVFFIGRMEHRKGFDILANAWTKVLAQIPSARLLVAGEDMACEHGPSFFDWATQNMTLASKATLKYLGPISAMQRERLYARCDFCVMPSRYESFGLVPLEVMKYAKPVISCQVGGIPEVIKHGTTGLLVPPEDPASLADAIVFLLRNKKLREELGEAAQKDLETNFSIERMVSETENFYLSLCS